ncbi:MAG: sugar phosphate isomerase/epimerase family protein [Halobacteriales archaeon]
MRTAINLYSVRELDEPTLDVLARVAAAGYDGVQFSGGLGDATPGDVADALDDHGLDVTPAHVGIGEIEDDTEAVLDTYADALGCAGVVVPHLGEEHFESADAVEETADRLSALADDLGAAGIDLHYHNHAHEFTDLGDATGFERFIEVSEDVYVELDVGWAQTGGADPVDLIERYGDRMPLIHMKDMTADGEFAEIGEGAVDMAACAGAAADAGGEWLIYEHDEPADPATSIEAGAEFLESL